MPLRRQCLPFSLTFGTIFHVRIARWFAKGLGHSDKSRIRDPGSGIGDVKSVKLIACGNPWRRASRYAGRPELAGDVQMRAGDSGSSGRARYIRCFEVCLWCRGLRDHSELHVVSDCGSERIWGSPSFTRWPPLSAGPSLLTPCGMRRVLPPPSLGSAHPNPLTPSIPHNGQLFKQ
jgi:hypothetical protein